MEAVIDRDSEFLVCGTDAPRGRLHRAGTARLDSRSLVILQLTARGHAVARIAQLRGEPLEHVIDSLQDTLDALETTTVRGAVLEAQRRGLII